MLLAFDFTVEHFCFCKDGSIKFSSVPLITVLWQIVVMPHNAVLWFLWPENIYRIVRSHFRFFFFPEEHISFYIWVLLNPKWVYMEGTGGGCEIIEPFPSYLKSILCCKQANSFATCSHLQAKMKWADVLYPIPSIQVSTVWKVLLPLA